MTRCCVCKLIFTSLRQLKEHIKSFHFRQSIIPVKYIRPEKVLMSRDVFEDIVRDIRHGVYTPIYVRPIKESPYKYVIVEGESRFFCARSLKCISIKCFIFPLIVKGYVLRSRKKSL